MRSVPEYDAFGREIGEDPLVALREATVAEPRSEPVVAEPVAAAPVAAEPEPVAAGPVVSRPRHTRPRRSVRLTPVIVLAVLIVAFGMVASVAVNRIESGLDAVIVQPEPEPAGLGPDSMLRARNLALALEMLRASGYGRPLTLRVTPARVDARLVGPSGRRTLVRIARGQGLQARPLPGRGGTGIPYTRINATVPERLVREDGRRVRFVRLDRDGWRARFR